MSSLHNPYTANDTLILADTTVLKSTTSDTLDEATEVADHVHPVLNRVSPSARFRRGVTRFTTAADTENFVIGTVAAPVTYTFKTALGSPAAANVHVKVQGTVPLTIAKLAQAIRGVTDAANIAYGTGTKPHPNVSGWFTSQACCVGTTQHAAGSNLYYRSNVADSTDTALPLTVSSTAATVVTAFTRVYSNRYVMSGNAAALGDRIAGGYQCIYPPGFIMDPDSGNAVKFDISIIVTEDVVSANRIIEMDCYTSLDEVTFTPAFYGLNLSMTTTGAGSQVHPTKMKQSTAGAGLYTKMRSNGTLATDWIDYKVQVHQYPG